MRATTNSGGTRLWLNADETYRWARRWPCSQIGGSRLYAEFESNGDLVDVKLDGRDADLDATEFNAITSDFLRERFGNDHPAIRS